MIEPNTMQFIEQLGGLTTYVEPDEDNRAQAYKLVPTTHWHQGNKFPHRIEVDLKGQSFRRMVVQGNEYYMVPEANAKVPYVRVGLEDKLPEVPVSTGVADKYMAADPKIRRVTKKIGK